MQEFMQWASTSRCVGRNELILPASINDKTEKNIWHLVFLISKDKRTFSRSIAGNQVLEVAAVSKVNVYFSSQ